MIFDALVLGTVSSRYIHTYICVCMCLCVSMFLKFSSMEFYVKTVYMYSYSFELIDSNIPKILQGIYEQHLKAEISCFFKVSG